MDKHWNRLPGEAVDILSLEMVSVWLEEALSSLVRLEAGSASNGRLGLVTSREHLLRGNCVTGTRCAAGSAVFTEGVALSVSRDKVTCRNCAVTLLLYGEPWTIQ